MLKFRKSKVKKPEKELDDKATQTRDLVSEKNKNSYGFIIIMSILVLAILATGILTSAQIHQYRQNYEALQEIKRNYMDLRVEYRRLLIEQQTFSTTQRIASRAVTELHMYFPSVDDKMILQPYWLKEQKNQTNSSNINKPTAKNEEVSQ
ncbi:MAG: cell division protein FtsL [Moraxellaceae bacterium]|nr:cell division protein FtsL [Moraxellaceae bacterium]